MRVKTCSSGSGSGSSPGLWHGTRNFVERRFVVDMFFNRGIDDVFGLLGEVA